ncbi:MAG TPA: outer membrane lipoprotein-sorting protein, partial [Verrucomicrobiae bacterium]|nr:outer membrane lipoprotein-sorting protein [Verrucomicrobiae bacterium]
NSKGYSKVLTWFDNDSLGVVQAQAYDAKGDEVKEFTPESVTKVNGQWQVDEIEMDDVQTYSRTVITFDLGH